MSVLHERQENIPTINLTVYLNDEKILFNYKFYSLWAILFCSRFVPILLSFKGIAPSSSNGSLRLLWLILPYTEACGQLRKFIHI